MLIILKQNFLNFILFRMAQWRKFSSFVKYILNQQHCKYYFPWLNIRSLSSKENRRVVRGHVFSAKALWHTSGIYYLGRKQTWTYINVRYSWTFMKWMPKT
jgi:hypothetical protein